MLVEKKSVTTNLLLIFPSLSDIDSGKTHFHKFPIITAVAFFMPRNKPASGCAQTLPDATPPIDKIHIFSKIAITFEQMMRFRYPLKF